MLRLLTLALTFLASDSTPAVEVPRPVSRPGIAAIITDPRLGELSGLARSRRMRERFWAINDGGNGNKLLLLDSRGHVLRTMQVPGTTNTDWEDLASFEWRGRKRLLIADTGDNTGAREHVTLWLLDEPDPRNPDSRADKAQAINFRYPDAAHDVESMTVDAQSGDVLVLSKRTVPPVLYRIPLSAVDHAGVVTADRVAVLAGVPQPSEREIARDGALSRYRSQTTAMELDCSGRGLLVLTYDAIYRYQRSAEQTWAQALPKQIPGRSDISLLPQAEAMALDADCRNLYVGSEKAPVPLLRFRYRALPEKAAAPRKSD